MDVANMIAQTGLPDQLEGIVRAVLPSLIAGVIGFAASRWALHQNSWRSDTRDFHARMEKAYMLRQRLYDSHRREVALLRRSDEHTPGPEWLKERNHPGEIMAELRMLISMYANSLDRFLDTCRESHDTLKKLFRSIDESVLRGDTSVLGDLELKAAAEKALADLDNGISRLREEIVTLVRYRTAHPRSRI